MIEEAWCPSSSLYEQKQAIIKRYIWDTFKYDTALLHGSSHELDIVHLANGNLSGDFAVKFNEGIQQAVSVTAPLDLQSGYWSALLESFRKVQFGTKERQIAHEYAARCILKKGRLHCVKSSNFTHVGDDRSEV